MADKWVPSADQERALRAVEGWYRAATAYGSPVYCEGPEEGEDDPQCPSRPHTHGVGGAGGGLAPVFSVGGLAGSGKTTIVMHLEWYLGSVRPVFAAPTNKAVAVLRHKRAEAEAGGSVCTCFRLAWRPVVRYTCSRSGQRVPVVRHVCPEGKGHISSSSREYALGGKDDEGSQCGCAHRFGTCGAHPGLGCAVEQQLSKARNTHLHGYHALVVIDEASMMTEADIDEIRSFGVPVLLIGDHGQLPPVQGEMNPWMRTPDVELTENHRQVGYGREIAQIAREVRGGLRLRPGQRREGLAVIARSDPAFVTLMERFEPGPERAVIVWTNRLRTVVNHLVRGGEGPVRVGDRVVCLSTCELGTAGGARELVRVHNGELGTVMRVESESDGVVPLVIKLDDPDAARGITRPAVHTRAAVAQFGRPEKLRENDPARPPGRRTAWQSWDFGYALTAHKAQGSEYDQVIVMDESPRDYARWMYTAVTRAARQLIVVHY